MVVNFRLPETQAIINLFLYKQIGNIDYSSDEIIKNDEYKSNYTVDVNYYMNEGAGRFATGYENPIVNAFMSGSDLGPGQYSKADIVAAYGIDPNNAFLQFRASSYSDTSDFGGTESDYWERTFIYETQSFRISDEAKFVIDQDGKKYIENFALEPYADDFDFQGGNPLINFQNYLTEKMVDPSEVGNTVEINFSGEATRTTYTQADFLQETSDIATWKSNAPSLAEWFESRNVMFDRLFDSGITNPIHLPNELYITQLSDGTPYPLYAEFEQTNKLIHWYGTFDDDLMVNDVRQLITDVPPTMLENATYNGVFLIGGTGNDTFIATHSMLTMAKGGAGNDTYDFTSETFADGGNDGFVFFGRGDGNDTIVSGTRVIDSDGETYAVDNTNAVLVIEVQAEGDLKRYALNERVHAVSVMEDSNSIHTTTIYEYDTKYEFIDGSGSIAFGRAYRTHDKYEDKFSSAITELNSIYSSTSSTLLLTKRLPNNEVALAFERFGGTDDSVYVGYMDTWTFA